MLRIFVLELHLTIKEDALKKRYRFPTGLMKTPQYMFLKSITPLLKKSKTLIRT